MPQLVRVVGDLADALDHRRCSSDRCDGGTKPTCAVSSFIPSSAASCAAALVHQRVRIGQLSSGTNPPVLRIGAIVDVVLAGKPHHPGGELQPAAAQHAELLVLALVVHLTSAPSAELHVLEPELLHAGDQLRRVARAAATSCTRRCRVRAIFMSSSM